VKKVKNRWTIVIGVSSDLEDIQITFLTILTCLAGCSRLMDVVIILDLSGSIYEVGRYEMMMELARAIVVGLPVAAGRARVGVVTYDSTARDQFYMRTFDRDVEALLNAFEFNHAGGTTNTQDALNLARTSQVSI